MLFGTLFDSYIMNNLKNPLTMKRILFLLAGLVAMSKTAFATTTTISEAEASLNNYVRGYGNSFIFNEGGIEFSVYRDGQFDFYIPDYGPDVSVGIDTPGFTLSFNAGYNYNPYVQYDRFGAIIQIENTPIFYDFYGRVNQIGDIFITYNGFYRISRIGGLNVYYRNNVFWRYDGFINVYNRAYVWRPWHRFYIIPQVNYCVINVNPYRQFYSPVRHIWYRPYRNNVRYFNVNNGRRGNTQITRRNSNRSYVQTPRTQRERIVQRTVTRRNAEITRTRTSRLAETTRTGSTVRTTRSSNNANSRSVRSRDNATTTRSNTRATTPRTTTRSDNRTISTRSKTRVSTPSRSTKSNLVRTTRSRNENVTRT
jgi:hypothetical protein